MLDTKTKPLSSLVFYPFLFLAFSMPFFSALAYPLMEIYYETALIVLAVLAFLTEVKHKFRLLPVKFDYFPVLMLLLAYVISTIYSINQLDSVKETFKFMSFAAVFFIASQFQESQRKLLIKVAVWAGVIISVYSIYQYFWGYQHTLDYLKKINSDFLATSSYAKDILMQKRVIGTFPSPNILGGYLIMIFFLGLQLLRDTRTQACPERSQGGHKGTRKILSLVLIAAALLLTKSLGAWLALIAASIILFLLSYKTLKHKKLILTVSLTAIFLIMTFILVTRWERLINLNNPQNSITQRLNYWRTAIAAIQDHPFLGAGPGNFQEVFLKYKIGLSTDTRYAHNIFLHTWAETGILGFTALIYIITVFFCHLRSRIGGGLYLARGHCILISQPY